MGYTGPPMVYLASQSPRRSQLLEQLGVRQIRDVLTKSDDFRAVTKKKQKIFSKAFQNFLLRQNFFVMKRNY
jgi:predicted house-cleaning NTP pyrophosphatase (Maf/HAM1 superfamily)